MKQIPLTTLLFLLVLSISSLSAQTPIPSGASFDLGFSPGGSSLEMVLKAISYAKSTLDVACYEFTARDIAAALESAAHRGVKVRIVADYKAAHDAISISPSSRPPASPSASMTIMRSCTTSSLLSIPFLSRQARSITDCSYRAQR